MLNDLLFSVLPREGKTPVSHDELKVKKIDKKDALKKIDQEDKPYSPDRDDPREKKRQRLSQQQQAETTEDKAQGAPTSDDINRQTGDPKFIDIEV